MGANADTSAIGDRKRRESRKTITILKTITIFYFTKCHFKGYQITGQKRFFKLFLTLLKPIPFPFHGFGKKACQKRSEPAKMDIFR